MKNQNDEPENEEQENDEPQNDEPEKNGIRVLVSYDMMVKFDGKFDFTIMS